MSKNNTIDTNQRWVKIGVLVAAIGALIAAFPMYLWYSQKEEKLLANGNFSKFILPERVRNDVFSYKSFSHDEIDAILKTIPTKEIYFSVSDPRNKILEYIDKVEESSDKSLTIVQTLSGFAELEVKNEGLRQADNVSLEFNKKGYFQINISDQLSYINKDSDIPPLQEFTNSIPLGTIRPKTSVKLFIWSNTNFTDYEKALVTYTNGAEPIVFNSSNESKLGFWQFLIGIGVVLLILGNVFQWGYKTGKKSSLPLTSPIKNSNATEPEKIIASTGKTDSKDFSNGNGETF